MTSITVSLNTQQNVSNATALDRFAASNPTPVSIPVPVPKAEESVVDKYASKKMAELRDELVKANVMPSSDGSWFNFNTQIRETRINQIKGQMAELKKDYPSVDQDGALATPSKFAKDTYDNAKMKLIDAKLMPDEPIGFMGLGGGAQKRNAEVSRLTDQIKRLEADNPGLVASNTAKTNSTTAMVPASATTTAKADPTSAQGYAQAQYTDLQKQLIDTKMLDNSGFVGLFREFKINDLNAKIKQIKSDYPAVSVDAGSNSASAYAKGRYGELQKDMAFAQSIPTGGPFEVFTTIRNNRINAVQAEMKELKSNFPTIDKGTKLVTQQNSGTPDSNSQTFTITFSNTERADKARELLYNKRSQIYDIDLSKDSVRNA
jgi:hypothetical protein